MSRMPILLFDVMDTLVHEPYFTALPKFFGMTLEELREQRHPTSWIEFEHGWLTETEYLAAYFKDGRAVDSESLRQVVYDSYRWLDGMEELLAELNAAGFAIHALSNYPVWYRMIDEKLALSRFIEWTFVSCNTGLRKPDREAYLSATEHLQVEPGQCLFVDDRQVNVDAARDVGMDAILAEHAQQIRGEFVRRGLLGEQ